MSETHHQENVVAAWKQELQTNQQSRWFAGLLYQQGEAVFQRFSEAYQQLTTLPRKTRRTLQRKWATTLTAAALAFALSGAPTINIAKAASEIVVDGKNCTLVDAITAANTDTAVGGCIAGDGPDTLILTKDITLKTINNSDFGNSGTPVVTSEITIEGNGRKIKRQSNDPFRIFTVAEGGALAIHNATISGGQADIGGGILVAGGAAYLQSTVISGNEAEGFGGGIALLGNNEDFKYSIALVASSTIENNTAGFSGGGIGAKYGSFAVTAHSTISGNDSGNFGGGISGFANSWVWTKYSTISNNTALYGGGISGFGNSLAIVGSSTVTGNEAELGGGVLSAVNFDGGKYGTLMINSTIAKNDALYGGGVATINGATATVFNTIAHNQATAYGGGLFSYESLVQVGASIIAGNHADEGGHEIADDIGDGPVSPSFARLRQAQQELGPLTSSPALASSKAKLMDKMLQTFGIPQLSSVIDSETNLWGHADIDSSEAFLNFTPDGSDFVATSDANDVELGDIVEVSGGNPRLRDNGGPTHTIALVDGSPAIDMLEDDGPDLDQRGFLRDEFPDVGAYEFGGQMLTANCGATSAFGGPYNFIYGTPGNDNIKGTSGNDVILGLGGNDRIEGLGGNDCLIGNHGDDQLFGGDGEDVLWGGEESNAEVHSSGDRDKLYGGKGEDTMYGGGDNDRLDGDDNNDWMYGDDGDDTMVGHKGHDFMYGGSGNDNMRGEDGDDWMAGEAGNDKLYGKQGNDTLDGGDDTDQLDGSSGFDTCTTGESLQGCEA